MSRLSRKKPMPGGPCRGQRQLPDGETAVAPSLAPAAGRGITLRRRQRQFTRPLHHYSAAAANNGFTAAQRVVHALLPYRHPQASLLAEEAQALLGIQAEHFTGTEEQTSVCHRKYHSIGMTELYFPPETGKTDLFSTELLVYLT